MADTPLPQLPAASAEVQYSPPPHHHLALLLSVFVIATCGLMYELIAGTLASYLLGDSVVQFSTIIGCYLFSMGIGSYLSRFIEKDLLKTFIQVEILVGVVGGLSATVLFLLFEFVESFRVLLYLLVGIIGILVGLEIPLMLRILQDRYPFKELVSKVFTLDYIGALFASILFPLVLVPQLGLMRSALLFGMLNVGVAVWVIIVLDSRVYQRYIKVACAALVVLALLFAFSESLVSTAEATRYQGRVIFLKNTPYQRIALVRSGSELRLFLNGNLQFSSRDEYRYHELLVHPAMYAVPKPERVLILGGGDGLAAREVLRHETVRSVVLVDLDRGMTDLFRGSEILRTLNNRALLSERVTVINEDAFGWIKRYRGEPFDVVIVDFPDPSNYSLGKLYSVAFYRALQGAMDSETVVSIQSTSPFYARRSFWCIANTVAASGLTTLPYHLYVPSFGEWGFILARQGEISPTIRGEHRFLTPETFKSATIFPPDMERVDTKVNRLDDQVLVRYFTQDWESAGGE